MPSTEPRPAHQSVSLLPDGATLVSQRTSLFDGKILNADDTEIWQNVGTGISPFANSMVTLTVEAGQYEISQSRRYIPYFSGKPQIVEITCDNFHTEPGVVKRIGYFSSNAVAPYDQDYDGFWIEDDGETKWIKAANNGTITLSIPLSAWRDTWQEHDYENFNVFQFYFLWLGGAALTLYGVKANEGFVHIGNADFVGNKMGTITKSPNQPLRYEIRSTTGTGTLRRICSQVSTAGTIKEAGKTTCAYNATALNCNSVGTTYALKGVKKIAIRRDTAIKITHIGCVSGATADAGILLLLRNPTLSAPLSYTDVDAHQDGTATNQTVTALGKVLFAIPCGQEASGSVLVDDYLTWLSTNIDNTLDEYVLAFTSTTANQARVGVINMVEYI